MLRWNRDQHMHMVGHQMTFFDAAVFVARKFVKDLTQMPTQLTVQDSTATFWNENNVVFALPLGVT